MPKIKLRIGTRDSRLAVWQAEKVKSALSAIKIDAELHLVKAQADKDLTTPLHEFGGTGIFTSILDRALLQGQIDIAVHSLKDYPTKAPDLICIAAVLERGDHNDILVFKGDDSFLQKGSEAIIATGSIRRIAQWKSRYPDHKVTGLRGNVQTRLKKLEESNWNGAIFAKAGLERVNLLPDNHKVLDWMIPAPAQGVIGIACREKDEEIIKLLKKINHKPTAITSAVERQFLNTTEGGCSAPIGALAIIDAARIYFKGGIFSPDGTTEAIGEVEEDLENYIDLGKKMAWKVLSEGGEGVMKKIRSNGYS